MAFTEKTLRATITLRSGTFPNSGGSNSIRIDGKHIKATINKPGGEDKNTLSCSIYGLSLSVMETASTLSFIPMQSEQNLISLEAGHVGGLFGTVFEGEFTLAYANFNGAPSVSFDITAASGIYPSLLPTPATGIQGSTDAATVCNQWATQAGYSFINNGVSASIRNTTFEGSPIEKLYKLAKQLDIELYIDDGIVTIQPKGATRNGNTPLIKLGTGLIGYPSFTQDGIEFKSEFNHNLQLGGAVKLESVVPRASGVWKISSLTHFLECHSPVGSSPWDSTVKGVYLQAE